MENITKADSVAIADNWDDLTERTECLERQLSKVKILSRPTESKGKINMEQQSQKVILTDPEEQQRTQYVPDAKVLIMKRPLQSVHLSAQTSKPKQPIKTLEQRQAEYNQARIRILGNAEPLNSTEKNSTVTDATLMDKSGDAVQSVQHGTTSRQPQQSQQKQKQQKQSQHKQPKPTVSNNRHNKTKTTEQQQPLQLQQQGSLAPSQPPVTPQHSGPYLPFLPSQNSHYVTECHQGVQQQYLAQQQQLYGMQQQQQYNSQQQQFNQQHQQYNAQQQQYSTPNQDSVSAPSQFVMPLPQYGQQFTMQRPPPSFPACLPVTRFMPAFLPPGGAPQYSQPQGYPSHMSYPPPLPYPPQPQHDNKRNPLLLFEQLGAEHYRRTETQLPQCNAVISRPDGSRGTVVNGEGGVAEFNATPCGSVSLQTAPGGKPHTTASCPSATFSGDNNGNGSTNSFGSCHFSEADASGNSLSSKSKPPITASIKKTSSAGSSARKSNRKNRKSLTANNSSISSVTGLSNITNGSSSAASGDAANNVDIPITNADNTSSKSDSSANICIPAVNCTDTPNNSTESSVPFTNTKKKKRGKKKNAALAFLTSSDPSTRTVVVSNSKDVNSRILRLPKGPDGTNGFNFIRQL